MADIKLSEITKELTTSQGNEFTYILDPNDVTDGPNGTSKKMQLSVSDAKDNTITRDKLGVELKSRVTANVSGTYAIDRALGVVYELTMTANTTFTDSNLVTGTTTEDILILLSGAFLPTFPAYWEVMPSSEAYDGGVRNLIIAITINGDTNNVIYQLQNLQT